MDTYVRTVRTYAYFPISLGETVTAYVRSYGNIIGAVLELILKITVKLPK